MNEMTIPELYDRLADKDFQEYTTGQLFFPAYMYMYDAKKEAEIEREIQDIQDRLKRPNNYLDVMVLDIFEELLNHLDGQKFGRAASKLQFYLENEARKPEAVESGVKDLAYSEEFLSAIEAKIQDHLIRAKHYEVAYVFMKGFGRAFPYIRVSRFMANFEKHINQYKLIVFYPGTTNGNYQLFGELDDEHLYRAIKLINEEP